MQNERDWLGALRLRGKQQDGNLDNTKRIQRAETNCLNCGENLVKEVGEFGNIPDKNLMKESPKIGFDSEYVEYSRKSDNTFCIPNTIPWEYMAKVLLDQFGVDKTLEMLQKTHIPKGEISFSFYQYCILHNCTEQKRYGQICIYT